jgi:hypothetical protein
MKRRASEYPVELPDFIVIHRPPPHEETESTKYKSFPRDKPGSSGVALIRITGWAERVANDKDPRALMAGGEYTIRDINPNGE